MVNLLPDGKPEGHANVSRIVRLLLRPVPGGAALVDFIEHFTPGELKRLATLRELFPEVARFVRGLLASRKG